MLSLSALFCSILKNKTKQKNKQTKQREFTPKNGRISDLRVPATTFPIPPASDNIMLLTGVSDSSQAISLNYMKSPKRHNSSSIGEKSAKLDERINKDWLIFT